MGVTFSILNCVMLTEILHALHSGDLERCRALGLNDEDLGLLREQAPGVLSRLAHVSVPWVRVRIDPPVLRRLIACGEREARNESLIDRAILLGASSSMLYRCFGLPHSETAMRRRLLKVAVQRGRPRHLSEAQEHALWQRWRQLSPPGSGNDPAEQLETMMLLAEEQQVSLTLIWQQVILHGSPR